MKVQIDRISTIGLFLTAMASPCCFPLLGVILTYVGLGSFELFGGWTMVVFQGLVLVSLVGTFLSYRVHRCLYPTLIALPSASLIFYSYHFMDNDKWSYVLYGGMIGLLAAAIVNHYRTRLHHRMKIEETSVIQCPSCGHQKAETMPTDACVYFYYCEQCNKRLKPLEGDCCVFCSYGTVKCPPIQQGASCCN